MVSEWTQYKDTVRAVVSLALDLVPNVNNPSHWWDLSMPLAKMVCFPNMIAAVLTENRFCLRINTKSIHTAKCPSLIGLEFLVP